MAGLPLLDLVALTLLGAATLRGLWIGAIREAFSLAALASAYLAVRLATTPLAEWVAEHLQPPLAPLTLRLACGAALAVVTVLAVGALGRWLRSGIRFAGLGLLDRLAGGALGAAEGALAVAVLVGVAVALLGPDHAGLRETRTLAAFQAGARAVGSPPAPPDVAAPPPR